MQLFREDFEMVDGRQVTATLDLSRRKIVTLQLRSEREIEKYVVGEENEIDFLTGEVTSIALMAGNMTWDDLQNEAEKLLSHDVWNNSGGSKWL